MSKPSFDKRSNTGFRHLRHAIGFSLQGLKACFRREAAFRQELALFALLLLAGGWLARSLGDFLLLLGACLLALMAELLNSGIEAAIDRFGGEQHELSGLAKDYGSAAVLLACLLVALAFGYLLLGHFRPGL